MWDFWAITPRRLFCLVGSKKECNGTQSRSHHAGLNLGVLQLFFNCHHVGALWLAHLYMMFHYGAGGNGHQGCVRVNDGANGRTMSMDWDIMFVDFVSGLDRILQISQVNGLNMSTQCV